MKKVYFARAMDGLVESEIISHYQNIENEFKQRDWSLINPYKTNSLIANIEIKEKAKKIVLDDLSMLKSADILLVDLSIPNHSYVGCICEIVYAYLWKIPIVVCVGDSHNEERLWLQYHANYIFKTYEEAISCMENI